MLKYCRPLVIDSDFGGVDVFDGLLGNFLFAFPLFVPGFKAYCTFNGTARMPLVRDCPMNFPFIVCNADLALLLLWNTMIAFLSPVITIFLTGPNFFPISNNSLYVMLGFKLRMYIAFFCCVLRLFFPLVELPLDVLVDGIGLNEGWLFVS